MKFWKPVFQSKRRTGVESQRIESERKVANREQKRGISNPSPFGKVSKTLISTVIVTFNSRKVYSLS